MFKNPRKVSIDSIEDLLDDYFDLPIRLYNKLEALAYWGREKYYSLKKIKTVLNSFIKEQEKPKAKRKKPIRKWDDPEEIIDSYLEEFNIDPATIDES